MHDTHDSRQETYIHVNEELNQVYVEAAALGSRKIPADGIDTAGTRPDGHKNRTRSTG